MTARVLVAGIGNIFLADDGFGSEVARKLTDRELPAGVTVTDYGIRGMHLAYDLLDGYDALVLIDAVPHQAAPGDLVLLEVGPDDLGEGKFDAHGMEPVAVLASLGTLGGDLPPTYVLGCQPADVGEGMGLTPSVAAAVEPAVAQALDLLDALVATPATAPLPTPASTPGRADRTLAHSLISDKENPE